MELRHIVRESNRIAYCMAIFASIDDLICHRFFIPPELIVPHCEEDVGTWEWAGCECLILPMYTRFSLLQYGMDFVVALHAGILV
ncbi:hypothetical protein V6N13_033945 [Hibiscus sabdariffa]|uniref:Uncharacterized protein n=1 Tax=Hibiscus sabdariffa TaxID=183260 RepID=A0ABR2F926_9ROSI